MPSTTPAAHPGKVGVVYLARLVEDHQAFQTFKSSYLRFSPGVQHDLIVIYKGDAGDASLAAAQAVFADLPHIPIALPDTGFDVGSYLSAAGMVDHRYLCCLNTFTELRAPGWLAALHRYASLPEVGIVGATASYESIHDLQRLHKWVTWLCTHDRIPFDPRIARYYESILATDGADWLASGRAEAAQWLGLKSLVRRVRGHRRAKRRWPTLHGHLVERWKTYTADGHAMARLARFPRFPNPHIRTNGFLVRRSHLLSTPYGVIADKLDACEFESGEDGLTQQLRRQGLRAVLVDRDGTGFDVADWWRSRTFRLNDQRGLLMSDNRTRAFDSLSEAERARVAWTTWGDYLGAGPRDLPRLDLSFPIDRTRTQPL